MAIYNYGSINIDMVYAVPHHPRPGETITSTTRTEGLGGKGANMSIAAVATGADVRHVGAIGRGGEWTLDTLRARGADVTGIATLDTATGHAIISVDPSGENVITLFPGANHALTRDMLETALSGIGPDDWLLVQNETAHVTHAVAHARNRGARIAYAAAPFDAETTLALLPGLDLLAVNEIEAQQLERAGGKPVTDLPVPRIIVTHGADGAILHAPDGPVEQSAIPAQAVDTTGAGDTFFGVYVGALAKGLDDAAAMALAARVASVQVTRPGAADAIPDRTEVARIETDL